ncbi:MAG: T9SS type A sorting domain-containing protein [Candidatus Cloacimonetes bacterium]|nr:T9SS type A sorting domain-containing protein [Candidatus Cloacimonadota bacterium]
MKKVIIFVSFLFIASLCFGDNMVDNPGFENWTAGSPDDWTTSGGSITLTQNTTNVHSGSSSCEVTWTSTSNQDLRSNTFSVTGGAAINASVWIYDNDAGGRARLSICYNGPSGGYNYYGSYSVDQDSWQEISYSGNVGPDYTTAYMQIRFYDVSPFPGSATVLVDDVSFEPQSTSALAISNVGREYTVPTAAQSCDITCDITGGTPPYNAVIKWFWEGAAQSDISMSSAGDDSYSGTIVAQNDGECVSYYIDVTDNAKANVTSSTYGLFWGTSPISNAAGDIREVDGSGVLVYNDYYARITGIATVASGVFSTSNLDVYLQDSYGGINLFKYGIESITAGNSYTAVGYLDQYNGKAELIPGGASDITDNGAGTMPAPAIITIAQFLANPEYYEGMLIGIQHLDKVDGTWGGNENLTMNDGGIDDLTLRIDGDTDIDENPEPTWPQDVVAIASQYDYSSPYDSGYQIFPRAFSDFYPDGTLPVELSSFTAVYANDYVTIQWATASETDVIGFNIYRSYDNNIDNSERVNISLIPGHGTTTQPHEYSFIDETADALYTTYYYWLESVNYGGTTDVYGSIQYDPVDVDGDGQLNTVVHSFLNDVFPNPVSVGQNVTFDFMIGGLEGTLRPVSLKIYDITGKLVQEVINEDMMVHDYSRNWHVNDLANGVYFYQLKTENYQETKKLVIQ